MIQHKNVPKLRFIEFNNEWEEKKLKELCTFTQGVQVAQFEQTNSKINGYVRYLYIRDFFTDKYKCYVKNVYPNKIIKSTEIMVVNTGNTAGQVFTGVTGVLSNNSFKIGFNLDIVNSSFLFRYLKSDRTQNIIKRFFNSGGQPHLGHNNIGLVKFAYPMLQEQQKITDFLGTIDDQISKLSLKVNLLQKYKKGMMQKIFSQEIRFKDKSGQKYSDWEKMRFGEVSERIVTKNVGNNKNVLTISAQQGLVCQTDYFNKSVSSTNLTGYYLLKKNDFAYNKSYSADYPMGAIKKLNHYNEGVVSTLYICFRVKKGYSSEFFEQYFNAGLQNKEISMIAQEGARNHGLLNIGVNDFFDGVILNVPKIDEQQKIAECLLLQDDKINLAKKELEQAKMFKKGLLQQMFI